jgi:hypothetical protein
MKLYVDGYNTSNLTSKLMSLDKYFINKHSQTEFYSDEGLFIINDVHLYKLSVKDEPIIKIINFCNNYTVLIDNSIITKTETSQIPIKFDLLHTTFFNYKTSSASNIQLVINGKYTPSQIMDVNTNANTKDKYNKFTIIDFYFEVANNIDIHNSLFKEELSVFLSMFN